MPQSPPFYGYSSACVCIEKYKSEIMAEDFRQNVLRRTSAESFHIDETKRPSFQLVNESFRKLAVD